MNRRAPVLSLIAAIAMLGAPLDETPRAEPRRPEPEPSPPRPKAATPPARAWSTLPSNELVSVRTDRRPAVNVSREARRRLRQMERDAGRDPAKAGA